MLPDKGVEVAVVGVDVCCGDGSGAVTACFVDELALDIAVGDVELCRGVI